MTISMPARPNFATSTFTLETNTQRFESPLTKAVQRVLLGGARWNASYTLPKMNRDGASLWQAFLLKCQGGVNTFYAFDPDARKPRGTGLNVGNTPLVNGASQTGASLITDGWTHGLANVLLPGDYFGVNAELKMCTDVINADGGGAATVLFQPPLRNSPADNAPLILDSPACTMILVDDKQAAWQADHNSIYNGITFQALEVFS